MWLCQNCGRRDVKHYLAACARCNLREEDSPPRWLIAVALTLYLISMLIYGWCGA